jgi:hypothetical protein
MTLNTSVIRTEAGLLFVGSELETDLSSGPEVTDVGL